MTEIMRRLFFIDRVPQLDRTSGAKVAILMGEEKREEKRRRKIERGNEKNGKIWREISNFYST